MLGLAKLKEFDGKTLYHRKGAMEVLHSISLTEKKNKTKVVPEACILLAQK